MSDKPKPDLKVVEFKKPDAAPELTLAERFRGLAEMIEKGDDKELSSAVSAVILLQDKDKGYITLLAAATVPMRSDVLWLLENVKMDCLLAARAG